MYHSEMSWKAFPGLAGVVLACLAASPVAAENPSDRLDRFRALAGARLSIAEIADPDRAAEAYRDLYALLDEEVVDSLASGGVFAAPAFLQLRMDGFAEAWGGARLQLQRVGPPREERRAQGRLLPQPVAVAVPAEPVPPRGALRRTCRASGASAAAHIVGQASGAAC